MSVQRLHQQTLTIQIEPAKCEPVQIVDLRDGAEPLGSRRAAFPWEFRVVGDLLRLNRPENQQDQRCSREQVLLHARSIRELWICFKTVTPSKTDPLCQKSVQI